MQKTLPIILAMGCATYTPPLEQQIQSHIIEFYMPSCGPCKKAEKSWNMHIQLPLKKIDIADNEEAMERYSVIGTPTFVFYQHGKEICRVEGYLNENFFLDRVTNCTRLLYSHNQK